MTTMTSHQEEKHALLEDTEAMEVPLMAARNPRCDRKEALKRGAASIALFICLALSLFPLYQILFSRAPPPPRSFLSHPDRLPFSTSKNAFVTYLPDPPRSSHEEDSHFTNARILAYQLLHDPSTRSNPSLPFIVLVSDSYPEDKRQRLVSDGAIVIAVEGVHRHRWTERTTRLGCHGDRFEKLRMFELYEFDLVCYISPSTLLSSSMDGVFKDSAVQTMPSLRYDGEHAGEPEEILEEHRKIIVPQSYTFAASSSNGHGDIFNEELFVVRPGGAMFDYYASLAGKVGKDEGLFNRAHERNGRMPWRRLDKRWDATSDAGETTASATSTTTEKTSARKLWERKKEEMERSLGNV